VVDINDWRDDAWARQKPLRELFADWETQATPEETRTEDLPFNVRCQNCLSQAGIETLGALNRTSINELMGIRAFGWGTLEKLLDTYVLTFPQLSFASQQVFSASQKTFEFRDETGVPTAPSFEAALGCDLDPAHCEYPLTRLPLSARAENILLSLGIQTVGQLIALSRWDIEQVPQAGAKTVADIEQVLQQFVASPQTIENSAIEADDSTPVCKDASRLLTVEDVVRTLHQWRCGTTQQDYEGGLPEGSSNCRKFGSYGELLGAVLDQCLRTPRRREVFVEYYGLFSAPLSRTELSEKHGVTPSRIYQLLAMNERTLNRFHSFRAVFSSPIGHLLRQHGGVLSIANLERGLAEQFGGTFGTVRGAGLLGMLSEFPEMVDGMSVLGRREQALGVAPPVTATALETLLEEIYEQLTASPEGVEEGKVERAMADHWVRVMPHHPVPDVAASDLVWLHPRIVVEGGVWRQRRRRPKTRVTDRLTLAGMMEAVLAENGRPMLVQDLFTVCQQRFGGINILACRSALQRNDNLFRTYGRGIQGLTCWGEYEASEIEVIKFQSRRNTPRSLRDKIELVLEEAGLPMSFQDLLRVLRVRFEEGDERCARSSLLVCPERFRGYGNGIYGLTAWEGDAGIVLEEAAIEFLESRGYPASETEICDGLRGQFPVSVPVCRWALRQAWERSGAIVPLDGGLWDLSYEDASEARSASVSVDDLLLEQLLSC